MCGYLTVLLFLAHVPALFGQPMERSLPSTHGTPISWLSFSPDGSRLAACALEDPHVSFFDVKKGTRLARIEMEGPASGAHLSTDGRTLAYAPLNGHEACQVTLFDVATSRHLTKLKHTGNVMSLEFTPNGAILVTREATGGAEGRVRLWTIPSGKERATFSTRDRWHHAPFSLSQDGELLAFTDDDVVRVVEVVTGKVLAVMQGHTQPVFALSFSPDHSLLASAQYEQKLVRLWRTTNGQEYQTLRWQVPPALSIPYTPVGSDKPTVISFEGSDEVYDTTFSPDGKTLATAHESGQVKLWEVATGKERAQLSEHKRVTTVSFAADGRTLLSMSGRWPLADKELRGQVKVWNLDALKREKSLKPEGGRVFVLSPDGSMFACGFKDGSVKVWELGPGTKK